MSEDDLASRARHRGWPDGLLARALAVRTPRWMLGEWLAPNGLRAFAVERNVAVFEALADGRLRARDLTFRDEESFSHLWANASEMIDGAEVTVERGPNAVAQFALQGDASVTVLEEAGELVACTVWAAQNCLVAGKPASVSYAQGLRVRNDKRRLGYGDIVRRWPSRALQKPTIGQVMYLRIGNAGIAGFLTAVQFRANRERPQSQAVATYFDTRHAATDEAARPVAEAELAVCAELINRTQAGLDLYMPYTADSLRLVLDEGFWGEPPPWRAKVYGWADFLVLEEQGRIVACAGLWDRGANMRERWHGKDGENWLVEAAALLDFGCAEGREDALARLIRALAVRSAALGRASLMAPLMHLPTVVEALADLAPREEVRTLEWSPSVPGAPARLGRAYSDLRYW